MHCPSWERLHVRPEACRYGFRQCSSDATLLGNPLREFVRQCSEIALKHQIAWSYRRNQSLQVKQFLTRGAQHERCSRQVLIHVVHW
jgi:hypothetical protein